MKHVADLLLDLVRIPSASSLSNRGVIDYAESVLLRAGWNASRLIHRDVGGTEKVNLIAAPPGQRSENPAADLAFLCHTDTVPPAADWTAALSPLIEQGVLYGCGACDVKGFLACLLAAVLETSDALHQKSLRIALTADEEIGCLGAHRLLAGDLLRPRSLIVGEPTSLHPARAGKGYCVGEITIFGAEAHSAHPDSGRSAIHDAARAILAIETFAERIAQTRNPFFDPAHTTLNIGTIHGGTAKNIVPGQCRFLLEWRPIPGESPAFVADGVRQLLDEMTQAGAVFQYTFTVLRQQYGFETPAEAMLVGRMEQLTGKPSISIPFGSEASVFAPIAEETIVFGPGDMRTAHSPRECVPIAELEQAVSCIKALMLD